MSFDFYLRNKKTILSFSKRKNVQQSLYLLKGFESLPQTQIF